MTNRFAKNTNGPTGSSVPTGRPGASSMRASRWRGLSVTGTTRGGEGGVSGFEDDYYTVTADEAESSLTWDT